MKKMKKLTSLLLVLVMSLALVIPCFAAKPDTAGSDTYTDPDISAMAASPTENTIVDRALEEVTGLYTDVYMISDASAQLMDQSIDEDGNDGGAFERCGLKELTLPDTITFINMGAFSDCAELTKIEIPPSVSGIGEGVFDGCESLTIYGSRGSFAESYAKENEIPFLAVE